MEDKELQELFDAKRTVEANRRRQEALAKMIDDLAVQEAKPKVRRMWPVWAGAAAAAVALLLITLPALFSNENTISTVVAETEVPEVVLPLATPEDVHDTMLPGKPRTPRKPSHLKAAPAARPEEEVLPEAAPMLPEPVIEEAPAIEEPVLPTETIAPTPRVMRRQSTLIACTEGCSAPEGTGETPSNSNVKVNFFSNENYADATIHTFVISK